LVGSIALAFCYGGYRYSNNFTVETADRENALFHFSCLLKILDTHRYQ